MGDSVTRKSICREPEYVSFKCEWMKRLRFDWEIEVWMKSVWDLLFMYSVGQKILKSVGVGKSKVITRQVDMSIDYYLLIFIGIFVHNCRCVCFIEYINS